MTRARPALAHALCALASLVLTATSLPACLYHERDPADGGTFVDAALADAALTDAALTDTAPTADAGFVCECPRPPPGCVYDGTPCGCSHTTCAPTRCGREVCGEGTSCCNASCGQCVLPGEGCLDVECAPDCSPQDAHSMGRCADGPGWAWDGQACRALSCRCEGTDCDAIFPTEAECNAVFAACPDCADDDVTGTGGCDLVLGWAFTTRGCMPVSGCSCVGTGCAVVEGRSEEACSLAHASCPILFP